MSWRFFLPQVMILFTAAAFSALTAALTWRHRELREGKLLVLMMFSIFIWTFSNAFEAAAVEQKVKILFNQIGYIGVNLMAPSTVLFALEYTRQLRKLKVVHLFMLFLLPTITILLAWTNAWHGLIWSGFSAGSAEYNILIYEHGPFFWIFVVSLYLYLFTASIILLREFIRTPRRFRFQLAVMLLASIFPAIGGLLYLVGLSPIPNLDLSPIGATITGILYFWGVIRLQLLDLMPVAREVLVEQMQDGVIVLDTRGRIVDTNRAVFRLLRWQEAAYIGRNAAEVLPLSIAECLQNAEETSTELAFNSPEETYLELAVATLYRRPGEEAGKLLTLRDITRRKMAELKLQQVNLQLNSQLKQVTEVKDQLEEQVIRDSLTGLYNRRFFDNALADLTSPTNPYKKSVGLLMIDIDYFKKINDEYGHLFGDQILKQLGHMLLEKTRRGDIACRYGGDEFVILLPNIAEAPLLERAEYFRRMVETLSFENMGKQIPLTISIGAAVYPFHGPTSADFIRASDQTLYHAKSKGRNCVVLFSEPLVSV